MVSTKKRVEEIKELRGAFYMDGIPRALALSCDRICIAQKRSYLVMSLTSGTIIKELNFTMTQDPIINCLQDRTQWCIQLDSKTVFFKFRFRTIIR